ncbi:MAG TPA: 8-amino-7-oxononanoate synthase [Bacteroidia bacterium]|jgi:8-amino-7-oxononanoate synthase|nr:8-amino-7-oxononanoate synthase [Bacteroidia bacterium]
MFQAEEALSDALQKREEQGLLRKLSISAKQIDFTSNDYLGFARSEELFKMIEEKTIRSKKRLGSGGSRLLSGNSKEAEELEIFLAKFHNAQTALLFNSGYDANMGLFSSISKKGDTIIYDELVHASIHDGMKLSKADTFSFRHNDLTHLEERLNKTEGNVFVAVESVYSMDGDCAPLKVISDLCVKYNANLIVDEAHATGIFGKGLVQNFELENNVFARVHTFGKAMGCHGAVILGSEILKKYLVNYARSFIYTTALPLHSLISIECAYRLLEKSISIQNKLSENISYFRKKIETPYKWLDSISAIQSLIVPGNIEVRELCSKIQERDMDVRPILSPTVQKGKERIRVCLHAYNTIEEIDLLFETIANA